jgi:hypothetical protein
MPELHHLSPWLVVALVACAKTPSGGPQWPPAVGRESLTVPADRLAAAEVLKSTLAAAVATKDCSRMAALFPRQVDELQTWCTHNVLDAIEPIELKIDPVYPIDRGFVADVSVRTDHVKSGGFAAFEPGSAYVGPDTTGAWRIFVGEPLPFSDPSRLTRLEAQVWMSPASEWLAVDATAVVDTGGARVLPFALAVHAPGDSGQLRVSEVTQEGEPCRFALHEGQLVVELAHPAAKTRLRIRYEGEPGQVSGDYISQKDIFLRGKEGKWLPLLHDTDADFDVRIVHPEGFRLFGQGHQDGPQPAADAGWEQTHWTFRGDSFTLYGAPAYVTRVVERGGTKVVLAVWPKDAIHLAEIANIVGRALDGLRPLGAYPYPELRIVESNFAGGGSGNGAISNIAIGDRTIRKGLDLGFVTHEISHGWFGGAVPVAVGQGGYWTESLAEYVSSWSMDPVAARAKRKLWSENYAALAAEKDRSILETTWDSGWEAHEAINYHKGALVLTALEARIGTPAMRRALATFLALRTGKPSTWSDVIAAIESASGKPPADWLRTTLSRAGAPDLRLTEIAATAGRLEAKLVQTTAPPFDGTVEIGFADASGGVIGVEHVAFTDATTAVRLPIPAGARRVVLDPEFRVPRHHDNDGSGIDVPLPAAVGR